MRKLSVLIFLLIQLVSLKGQNTCGTVFQTGNELDAYTLFCPSNATTTYLIDNCGRVMHQWTSSYKPGVAIDFLENGNLLRSCEYPNANFGIAGMGGRIEILDWNSNILWEYVVSDSNVVQHHDVEYLPNGNIIVLAIERKTSLECYSAGRDTINSLSHGELYSEFLIELQPIGQDSAIVVWEWHMWDHLVQDFNPNVANYGVVEAHPELFNVNYVKNNPVADWAHANSVFYNQDLDQLVVSLNSFSEFIIIDHSTTINESQSHAGGNMGKGGDILFRYGNPIVYGHNTIAGQQNESQHTVHWIPNTYKDGGKILLFNNGSVRGYSSVDIVNPLKDTNGNYILEPDTTFGPDTAEWSYVASPPASMYSSIISGAQRLSNGNTLICEGRQGHFIEIDSLNNIVWEYFNPQSGAGIMSQGDPLTVGRAVFRAKKYEPSYSGFIGKNLTPGIPIESNPNLVGCITNIKESDDNDFRIFPNPTEGFINIEFKPIIIGKEVEIVDGLGRSIYKFQIINNRYCINLPQSGLYFLIIDGVSKKIVRL